MTFTPETRADLGRFWTTIEASGQIGKGRPGGLSRLTLTDSDREMRDLFVEWCEDAGLDVQIDQMGNIFGRRAGTDDSLPPGMKLRAGVRHILSDQFRQWSSGPWRKNDPRLQRYQRLLGQSD